MSGLQPGRAGVLRGLRNFLNMDRPKHHSTDRLKEKGMKKTKRPPLHPPRSRTICVQPDKALQFRGQPWGDCWETGRSAYGSFGALRCYLETETDFVVCWLLNVQATCKCILGTDLFRQFYVLPC